MVEAEIRVRLQGVELDLIRSHRPVIAKAHELQQARLVEPELLEEDVEVYPRGLVVEAAPREGRAAQLLAQLPLHAIELERAAELPREGLQHAALDLADPVGGPVNDERPQLPPLGPMGAVLLTLGAWALLSSVAALVVASGGMTLALALGSAAGFGFAGTMGARRGPPPADLRRGRRVCAPVNASHCAT